MKGLFKYWNCFSLSTVYSEEMCEIVNMWDFVIIKNQYGVLKVLDFSMFSPGSKSSLWKLHNKLKV